MKKEELQQNMKDRMQQFEDGGLRLLKKGQKGIVHAIFSRFGLVLLLMLLAVVTKVIGCGLGAKIMRYTNKESLQIGIGMISRGEVALIVANKGASVGLMSEKFMTPLVIMVVFTTIVTPILLKFVFPKKKDNSGETPSGELAGLEKSGINTGLEES